MLIGNIISFAGACFTLLSAWSRDRKRIYLYQAAQCLLLAIANIFFASVSGVTTCALCAVRNGLLAYDRFTARHCAVFVVAVAALGLWVNNRGPVGLLPVVTTVIYTVGCFYARRSAPIKLNMIVNLVLWTAYDLLVGDFVSAAVDSVSAVTALVSIVRGPQGGT
ncbi:MAG: YgjV family protein [Oscillospiraceae bacterium]|nr:YgjV family protein [Oscillospiraceae bacterium]